MISGHDYRTARKANVHFIARELEHRGPTRFFSIGFSLLSKVKEDPRISLWDKSNRVENYQGVDCFLWKTLLHPVNMRFSFLSGLLERPWFKGYVESAPEPLGQWIKEANIVLLESGMSVIFFGLVKKLNPGAKIIYLCSDALGTIGCAPFLSRELTRIIPFLDGIRIPSRCLAPEFQSSQCVYIVPHGMDALPSQQTPIQNPYSGGVNLVSVGSMLFDPGFFVIAAAAFSNITFHIIGGGRKASGLQASNIVVYGEMPYLKTLPYIKYADAGVAPYEGRKVAHYLADTSMKLMQYEAFGLPAICPKTAVGQHHSRFGYDPDDSQSVVEAIQKALAYGRFAGEAPLRWLDVVDRILDAQKYPDARMTFEAVLQR